MVLRTKKLLFLVLVVNTCSTKFANGDESNDSDDDRLQQALVLVEILKSEYIKAIHENAFLRENTNNTSEELSTCATTEEEKFSSTDSSFNHNITTTPSTLMASLSPVVSPRSLPYATRLPTYQERQPLLPYFQQGPPFFPQQPSQTVDPLIPMAPQLYGRTVPPNYALRYDAQQMGPYRRMIPKDYYYYDNARMSNLPFFYRRMQNRDEKVNESRIENTAITQQNSSTPRSTVIKTTRIKSVIKNKTQSLKKKVQKTLPNKKARWRNPILNQVAEELIKEIGVGNPRNKNTSYLKKKHRYSKPKLRSKSEKNKTKTKETARPMLTKTTLRIHMEGSTRLALPLSENNAFCFFSPKSTLCRSSI